MVGKHLPRPVLGHALLPNSIVSSAESLTNFLLMIWVITRSWRNRGSSWEDQKSSLGNTVITEIPFLVKSLYLAPNTQ